MYWGWVQQFRGNRDEKTHTYPLDLAKLVGEEVMVHLRSFDELAQVSRPRQPRGVIVLTFGFLGHC